MKNWLKRLFHLHKWEIHERATMYHFGNEVGAIYVSRCSECGAMKSLKVSL